MRRERASWAAALTTAVIAVSILASLPLVQARPNAGAVIGPPYGGTWSSSISGGLAGCGTGSIHDRVRSFNLTDGTFKLRQRSFGSNRGCPSLPAYSTVNGSTLVEFVAPTTYLKHGTHELISHWSLNWTLSVNETIRSTPNPPSAYAELSLATYLRSANGTNYSSFYGQWGSGAVCLNLGNASSSGHARFALLTNVTVPTSGRYAFVADLYAITGVFIDGFGNTASATADIGTSGHYAKLLSTQIR
jgi:hypothetical protein